ncbi:MAG TPA: hypothetical protein VF388_00390 [Lacunisphaera sp.]
MTTDASEPRGGFLAPPTLMAPLIVEAAFAPLMVSKMTSVVPMTPELLAEAQEMSDAQALMLRLLDGTATPEERAAADERKARYEAEREAKHDAAVAEWEQVRARYADVPAVLAALDIHQPDGERLECQHPIGGWEADPEDWPCSTYVAIRDAVN